MEFRLTIEGNPNKEIARILKKHTKNIEYKSQIKNIIKEKKENES